MSELSPAAKAILVAQAKSRCLREERGREERGCHPTDSDWNGCWICVHRKGVAAALLAAADQIVPANGSRKNNEIRSKILAIADELEA
jgi:hypothetical protein